MNGGYLAYQPMLEYVKTRYGKETGERVVCEIGGPSPRLGVAQWIAKAHAQKPHAVHGWVEAVELTTKQFKSLCRRTGHPFK